MQFINYTINEPFEYQNFVLGDLKKNIMQQDSLNYEDVLRGYHEKNNLVIEYENYSKPVSQAVLDDIKNMYYAFLKNFKEQMVKDYLEKREALIEEYKPAFESNENLVSKYKSFDDYLNATKDKGQYYSSNPLVKACNSFTYDFREYLAQSYKDMCDNIFRREVLRKYPYLYIPKIAYHTEEDKHRLPYRINFSTDYRENIDFENIIDENNTTIELEDNSYVSMTNELPEDKLVRDFKGYDDGEIKIYIGHNFINLYTALDKNDAIKKFEKGIEDCIKKVSEYEWSQDEYLYEIDNSPITININDNTGKVELLDGYKRLLFNMDEKCMSLETPVRVFRNLSDEKFLNMLFSLNKWKTIGSDQLTPPFFDRGFLFALKQRFGFEIPREKFESAGCLSLSGLRYLNWYDFNNLGYSEEKGFDFNASIKHREEYINDIKLLYSDEFSDLLEENHGYDVAQYNPFIARTVIKNIGALRRLDKVQKPLTIELLKSIFEDKDVITVCKKRTYSSETYVDKAFSDKGLYKRIENLLLDNLTEEKEIDLEYEAESEDVDYEI